jgi:hypothetical protein
MNPSWRPILWFAGVVVFLSIAGTSSADRWYEDYERAVVLIGDNTCSREALQLLGAAVVDKPRPRLNARTIAVKTIDYLPYYQFARAHLACGDADSARYYLSMSRERGVAPSHLLDAVEARIAAFESQPTAGEVQAVDSEELAALVREVNSDIRQARSLAERISRARGDQRFAAVFSARGTELNEAASDLDSANERLGEGTLQRDRAMIEEAKETVSRVIRVYSGIEREISNIRSLPPTATPLVVVPTATSTPALPRTMTPVPRLIVPTPTSTPFGPRESTPIVTSDAHEVAAGLRRAALDYLSHDYEQVAHELKPEEFSAPHERAAAYLLRAASHFALFCLGGREDNTALTDARHDLQRIAESDASVEPDPRFFSPEFVTLFRSIEGED